MYKVIKRKGAYQNVSVMNTETHSSIIIGKVNMKILSILEADGLTIADGLAMSEEWEINISKEAATELVNLTMRIGAPDRSHIQKRSEQESPEEVAKTNKQPVDVFNLIFGTD